VQTWRSALSEVALLKGDHIKENEYVLASGYY